MLTFRAACIFGLYLFKKSFGIFFMIITLIYITEEQNRITTIYIWWPKLIELTPMIFNIVLTHLGSEASI